MWCFESVSTLYLPKCVFLNSSLMESVKSVINDCYNNGALRAIKNVLFVTFIASVYAELVESLTTEKELVVNVLHSSTVKIGYKYGTKVTRICL